ncbi:MAG: tetratricopeptide repeat protein [Bryobacteraceae bacterium]
MRALLLLAACTVLLAQPSDPLARAYAALQSRDYDTAVSQFLQAIDLAPQRAAIRKDLAYTYLKIGENDLAREQFQEAMLLDPKDLPVAMEYAFLCFESKQESQARRIFDRIRKTDSPSAPVAEKAFRNIDDPLAAGIDRWQKAIALGADTFDAHYQLASLAEQRDQLPLAAEHYEKAWLILPDRRSVLLDLGRVWKAQLRNEDANAALLAASRGGEPVAADMARELLPKHYPYVAEFRHALELDPVNGALRRELGFLLLGMAKPADAEREFRIQTQTDPADVLSAAQLGFMLHSRGDQAGAKPLFDRVLAGKDQALANRVRAVLHLPQIAPTGGPAALPEGERVDPKTMGERSMKAGYIKDAARYLRTAHEADPSDYGVMLELATALNILGQDSEAIHWFQMARSSPDPTTAAEATKAWRNLRGSAGLVRFSAWIYPLFSTRWHDAFGYGQIKAEFRTGLPIHPYLSVRLVGDARVSEGLPALAGPQYLSESSVIVGAGLATIPWHHIFLWGEAGNSMSYINGHKLPDYRGGLSASLAVGHSLRAESTGPFADTTLDAVFVSRFNNDAILYSQSRGGYTFGSGGFRGQVFWNANLTIDDQRQYWANFVETGPGLRFTASFLPPSMYFTVSGLRGAYLVNAGNPRGPTFNDLRAGVWYAFSH